MLRGSVAQAEPPGQLSDDVARRRRLRARLHVDSGGAPLSYGSTLVYRLGVGFCFVRVRGHRCA